MRCETKRAYEKRIADLEDRLEKCQERVTQNAHKARMWKDSFNRLHEARRQGEDNRSWSVELAIRAGQADVVGAAKQIADFVYGPDIEADREAENP